MLPASPPRRSAALAVLTRRADALGATALDEAIPTAGVNERLPLVQALVSIDPAKGLSAVVRHLHELPNSVQEHARAHADRLDAPIREALVSRQPAAVANAIELLVELRLARLAYLLPEAVRHGPGETRKQAAMGLLSLAKARQEIPADQRPHLCSAIEPTIVAYERHPHPALLDAFLELLTCSMPQAWSALSDPEHPAVGPLRDRLAAGRSPASRTALLPMFTVPTLTHACAAGLRQAIEQGQLNEVLTHAWALTQTSVLHSLQRLDPPEPYLPKPQAIAQLDDAARASLADYYAALPLPPDRLIQQLSVLLEDGAPAVRLSALRVWVHVDRSEPAVRQRMIEGLGTLTQDRESSLARLALRTLESWGESLVRAAAGKLLHSPHEFVRDAINRRLGVVAFEKLWKRWAEMQPEHRLLTARAVRKIDPEFEHRLRQKLAGRAEDRTRALALIHLLHLGPALAESILPLGSDADVHVLATAAIVLGQIDRPAAQEMLTKLMHHPDPRVRANAIEAMNHQQQHRQTSELLLVAERDQPRPRANAIRALLDLRTEQAVAALLRMLNDPRPEHRLSALWLVEAAGLNDLARQVQQLAQHDRDPRVAQKADDVAYGLLHDLIHEPQTPVNPAA
jgi:HEAT repeat protein